jgi:hypothetical protein
MCCGQDLSGRKGGNGEILAATIEMLKWTYLWHFWGYFRAEKSSSPCQMSLQMIPLCFMKLRGVEVGM